MTNSANRGVGRMALAFALFLFPLCLPSKTLSDHGGLPSKTPKDHGGLPSKKPEDHGGLPSKKPPDYGGLPSKTPEDHGGVPPMTPEDYGGRPLMTPADYTGFPSTTPEDYGYVPSPTPQDYGGPPPMTPPDYGGPHPMTPLDYGGPHPMTPEDYLDDTVDDFSLFDSLDMPTAEQYRRLDDWLCLYARFCPSACTPCYDDERCQLYGDCCAVFRHGTSEHIPDDPYSSTACLKPLGVRMAYRMVTSCPRDSNATKLAGKCENPDAEDWREQVPVTDVETELTYRNIYCAECNDVSNFTFWNLEVTCASKEDGALLFSSASSVDDLFKEAPHLPFCEVIIQPLSTTVVRFCSDVRENLTSQCNVTGRWLDYDARLVRACAESTLPPYDLYKNAFCYLCNERVSSTEQERCKISFRPRFYPLTALLNLQDDVIDENEMTFPGVKQETACEETEFFDSVSCSCRRVGCALGRVYRDGSCISLVTTSRLTGYDVHLSVTMSSLADSTDRVQQRLQKFLEQLQNVVSQFESFLVDFVKMDLVSAECEEEEDLVLNYDVTIRMLPLTAVSAPDVEWRMLGFFGSAQLKDELKVSEASLTTFLLPPHWIETVTIVTCRSNGSDVVLELVNSQNFEGNVPPEIREHFRENVIISQLNYLLVCPWLELFSGEFNVLLTQQQLVVVESNRPVDSTRFEFRNSSARICLEDYVDQRERNCSNSSGSPMNESGSSVSPGKVRSIPSILSVACTVVSLACLAATLLVFVCVDALRTTSGQCTVCMVGVLFLAQGVFQFGANQTETAELCVALGVLAHYLWLSATFWMNACTVLMFFKLVFPLRALVHLSSTARVLKLASVHGFLSPALVVLSAMGANRSLHGDWGYGGAVCYISRATTRRFAFALPVAGLVAVNLGLFSVAVASVRRGARPACCRDSRLGLVACAKLSALTGAAWAAPFLHEALLSAVTEYLAVVVLGLHGVTVFLALVLNARVLGLLRQRLCRGAAPPSRSHLSSSGLEPGLGRPSTPPDQMVSSLATTAM